MARNNHATSTLLSDMVAAARELKGELLIRRGDAALAAACESLASALDRDVSADEAADALAQAVVCARPLVGHRERSIALDWLDESLSNWEQWALRTAQYSVLSTKHQVLSTDEAGSRTSGDHDSPHLYDQFLHRYAPPARKHHGVFFTPQPIANYIVRQIDTVLRHDFALPDGLATHSAFRNPHSALRFLDPACGTGIFLLAVIDHLSRRLGNDWNDFVPDLLPRLAGIELLPVPAFLAKLNIALALAESGYDFRRPGRIQIHLGDALNPNLHSATRNPQSAIPVILGNPPFSSLSTNTNPWIARLVRGDNEVRGYVQAGDVRLGERKTWLHDDYVKFIRLAQWIVEEAGAGIVAFVTNHGYLDNTTFRLLRQELLRVFPHVQIVDLHGNRKKGETAPGGGPDENVFGLDQGVAIGLLAKPTRSASEGVLRSEVTRASYVDLWGTREGKLASLGAAPSLALQACVVTPLSPHWRFVPAATIACPEYDAGWPLQKAMPVNTTAPVTARDHFVVAFTQGELEQRIAEFRDLSIPDEVIRERYFTRTRSRRYLPGDTRSWKLAAARRAVAADDAWQTHIIRCLYRPFDWRYVFWHPAMIDWPRTEVTRHLVSNLTEQRAGEGERERRRVGEVRAESSPPLPLTPSPHLCLIARRQQLPTQPCTFFWVSDCLALDGVIRSDNRGSESLFPLWLSGAGDSRAANFDPALIEQVARQIGRQPAAEDLLAYIYALFHSPAYRERYAHLLRSDFPRVLLPGSDELFTTLAVFGQRLIGLHLLRGQAGVCSGTPRSELRPEGPTGSSPDREVGDSTEQGPHKARRADTDSGECVGPADLTQGSHWRLTPTSRSGLLPNGPPGLVKSCSQLLVTALGADRTADFRVGGYHVLKKWLQPKHRSPDDSQFRHIAAAIEKTIAIMAAIDEVTQFHGFMK